MDKSKIYETGKVGGGGRMSKHNEKAVPYLPLYT
jgi:hypothetical protein